MLTTQGNTESGGSSAVWAAGLNKTTGCNSPRCRRCKCRDSLPLTKVSHWFSTEKADRAIDRDTSQKTSRIFAVAASSRAQEEADVLYRRNTAAVALGTATAAVLLTCSYPPTAIMPKRTELATPSGIFAQKNTPSQAAYKKEMTLDDFCSRFLRQGSSLFCLII